MASLGVQLANPVMLAGVTGDSQLLATVCARVYVFLAIWPNFLVFAAKKIVDSLRMGAQRNERMYRRDDQVCRFVEETLMGH